MTKIVRCVTFLILLWNLPVFADEKSFHFVLADIEPYVIHQPDEIGPVQGLEVEIMQLIAEHIKRPIVLSVIPTRRYITGAIPGRFDGSMYSDYLYEKLPAIRAQYEPVEKVFKSSMLFFRQAIPDLPPGSPKLLKGVMGQVANSCDPFLPPQMATLKKFDVKDPDQGLLMLYKSRLDYLCMSDTVTYQLLKKQKPAEPRVEILGSLGDFSVNLVLNRDLPAADRDLFRNALIELHKNGRLLPILKRYTPEGTKPLQTFPE